MSPIICTVDIVLLTLQRGMLHVALLKRDHAPFAGVLALPGGYVHAAEDADARDAAERTLREKTGIVSPYLEQLATFSGLARDPRGWSLSVTYYALVPDDVIAAANRPEVVLVAIDKLRGLPFDHQQIIATAVQRVRDKSAYSSLPVYLCGKCFTLPQLQSVYEAILGEPINKVSFRRKIDELDILEPIEGALEAGKAHRPAQMYRLKPRYGQHLSLTNRALNARS
ncbi:MAG: NUDIX domain-containing protein [Azonexus sp.]|jgi:8-oxo-dGTP diphosphatase|uniref:NUDIX hydrolase n=1 Tax=Azonexus sp. TaxID=1872668 RepID=UPI0028344A21|nr:NUDIX domain-containing protein [Azonexus sp.]MDR0777300.1 NUDIX domain-containing protein [Azonexus sp.]